MEVGGRKVWCRRNVVPLSPVNGSHLHSHLAWQPGTLDPILAAKISWVQGYEVT